MLKTSPGYAAMVDLLRAVVEVRRWDGVAMFPSVLDWLETDVRAWTLRPLISDDAFKELRARAPHDLARFCEPDGSVSLPAAAVVADSLAPR